MTAAPKILGTPLKQKLPGIEFARAPDGKDGTGEKTLYLLGAKPGIAEQAAEKLREIYPGLTIAGTHDGYLQKDETVVAEYRRQYGGRGLLWCPGAETGEVDGGTVLPPVRIFCCWD